MSTAPTWWWYFLVALAFAGWLTVIVILWVWQRSEAWWHRHSEALDAKWRKELRCAQEEARIERERADRMQRWADERYSDLQEAYARIEELEATRPQQGEVSMTPTPTPPSQQ